jgi:acyl-CoA reductase-like NAD-dependent aldehyde dehydrogenase
MADAIDTNSDVLARLVTTEQGKPLALAHFEVGFLTFWLRETARMDLPEIVNQDDGERLSVTRRIPLGVVAAITPWNYPIGQNAPLPLPRNRSRGGQTRRGCNTNRAGGLCLRR